MVPGPRLIMTGLLTKMVEDLKRKNVLLIKQMTGLWNKWHTTEDEMKELVFQAPVATTVYASYFGDYGGGVYEDSRCCEADSDPNCIWTLNHEVAVIGYGHESGKDYWLVKNSWGKWWGDNGYIKIKRG